MAAFFAAIDTLAKQFNDSLATQLLSALQRYGSDSGELNVVEFAAAGLHTSQHSKASGESVLIRTDKNELFVFTGRVDNRAALHVELAADKSDARAVGDGELMLAWLQRFGKSRLATVIGPYSFVLIDLNDATIIAARDPMGGRSLSFCRVGSILCFATDESIFNCVPNFSTELNQDKVARHLLLIMDDQPSSFFKNARTVRPGEVVEQRSGVLSRTRFYAPKFDRQVYRQSLDTNATRFRELFDQAVKRRLNRAGATGVMLSGGLDSVPIAISAQQLAAQNGQEIVAISWVFPQTPAADELQYSEPLCKRLGIQQIKIDCDATPPHLQDGFVVDPRIPFSMPFVAYQEATLKRAAVDDIPVLLTGMHGDLLYVGAKDVVYRALAKGHLGLAIKEFKQLCILNGSTFKAVKRYLLAPLLQWRKPLSARRGANPRIRLMLSDALGKALSFQSHWLESESKPFPRPEQYQKILDGFAGEDAMHGRFLDAGYGVERRYPLRDRELCEFMLSVPSEQLYHLGEMRPLLKVAFKSELPNDIARRNDKTLFTEPVVKQIMADEHLKNDVEQGKPYWSQYVRDSYFDNADENYELRQLALWRCAYYNFWRKRVPTTTPSR